MSSIPVEEMARRPGLHLPAVRSSPQRVLRPLQSDGRAEEASGGDRGLCDILEPSCHLDGKITVDVDLVHEPERTHLIPVWLKQHADNALILGAGSPLTEPCRTPSADVMPGAP